MSSHSPLSQASPPTALPPDRDAGARTESHGWKGRCGRPPLAWGPGNPTRAASASPVPCPHGAPGSRLKPSGPTHVPKCACLCAHMFACKHVCMRAHACMCVCVYHLCPPKNANLRAAPIRTAALHPPCDSHALREPRNFHQIKIPKGKQTKARHVASPRGTESSPQTCGLPPTPPVTCCEASLLCRSPA